MPEQAGWKHPCLVDHEKVSLSKEGSEVREPGVNERAAIEMKHHQPRIAA
jgi:hypothetical protein